ncbi:MAG: hypothetical protein ACKVPJ_09525, partial [Chitinophagales bacterium]
MKFFYRLFTFLLFCITVTLGSCKRNASQSSEDIISDSTTINIDSGSIISADTFHIPVSDTADFAFRFNPIVGKTYSVYNSSISSITSTMPSGEKQTLKTEDVINLSMFIKEKKADGNFVVELVQKSARQMMEMGNEKQEYISGKPMADPQADIDRKLLDCMINVPIILLMNTNAEITETKGLDAIKSKMSKVLGDSIPADQIPVPDPSEAVENLFLTFPEGTVNKGSTWEKTLPSSVQGLPIL